MGAGPLHLLKSGLAVRLEEEGHHVTIRAVELPPGFRATEIDGPALKTFNGVSRRSPGASPFEPLLSPRSIPQVM
jgi:hypothetical protein